MVKLILRILLSPIVFFIYFAGLIIIPIGVMALMFGLIQITYNWVMGREQQHESWFFTFTLFIVPTLAAIAFIKGESFE